MITVWDDEKKAHVQMSYADSVKHSMQEWGDVDFYSSVDFYERNAKEVNAVMKSSGYKFAFYDKRGKPTYSRGMACFTKNEPVLIK